MRRHAKASTAGSTDCQATGLGHILSGVAALLAAAFAAAAFALVFASAAQAVTYSPGAPLITGKLATSVAVNQSTRDVYVSNVASEFIGFDAGGGLQRFSSAGSELTCTLSPPSSLPGGLAVNPSNGNLYVAELAHNGVATVNELRTYPAGCGAELASNTGTGNTTSGSNQLTSVSMAHPLQVGQGISGPGIPTASATGDLSGSSPVVTNLSGISGTFAVGQAVSGPFIPSGTTIVACTPSCAAPTEIELSANSGICRKLRSLPGPRSARSPARL